MKYLITTLLATALFAFSPSSGKFPDIQIKDLNGQNVMSKSILNTEGPTIVSFWATWCKPCILELNTIAEEYQDWVDETGVKLIAISIDDSRQAAKVPMMVNGRGWEYDVYIDANSDLRRALSVNNVPHTFLLDKEGNILYDHNSFTPGDEVKLYELVKKVANGEEIPQH